MTFFDAIILGAVEGVTEFLPVSSTGHLILATTVLGIGGDSFVKTFEIAIQLGAILAVVVLYWRTITTRLHLMGKVLVAFVPTGAAGLLLYKLLKTYLLGNPFVVVFSLFAGGLILILFERWYRPEMATKRSMEEISYRDALLIGVAQSFAIVPGVSRSGATAVGGMLLGLPRTEVVEFSFLLAIPTMLAATAFDLFKSGFTFSSDQLALLGTGFVTAFCVALVSVRFLLAHIQKSTFEVYGLYRILLAALFFFVVLR